MPAAPDVVAHLLRAVVDQLADVGGENEGPRQVIALGVPLGERLDLPKRGVIVALTYQPDALCWALWRVEVEDGGRRQLRRQPPGISRQRPRCTRRSSGPPAPTSGRGALLSGELGLGHNRAVIAIASRCWS